MRWSYNQDSVGRLSRMDALQQKAMAQAQERRRAQERARINAALERIDEGEWGYCLTCGEENAEARLRHDPRVAVCVGCASGAGLDRLTVRPLLLAFALFTAGYVQAEEPSCVDGSIAHLPARWGD